MYATYSWEIWFWKKAARTRKRMIYFLILHWRAMLRIFQKDFKKVNSSSITLYRFSLIRHRLFLIGQFNLGFLVCILKKGTSNQIFIIDQHAADEKFNYESLMRDFKPASQKLVQYIELLWFKIQIFRPLNIFLSGTRASILRENIEIIEKNGFKVALSNDRESFQNARITSLPIAKNNTFGEDGSFYTIEIKIT